MPYEESPVAHQKFTQLSSWIEIFFLQWCCTYKYTCLFNLCFDKLSTVSRLLIYARVDFAMKEDLCGKPARKRRALDANSPNKTFELVTQDTLIEVLNRPTSHELLREVFSVGPSLPFNFITEKLLKVIKIHHKFVYIILFWHISCSTIYSS